MPGLPFFPCDECLTCDCGHVLRGGSYMSCNRKKNQERPSYCPERADAEPLAAWKARQPQPPSILKRQLG